MKGLLILFGLFCNSLAVYHDGYSGRPLTTKEVGQKEQDGTLEWCTNDIQPCNSQEGRRVDGSCNNMKYPLEGCKQTPFRRLLPAYIHDDGDKNKAVSGEDLPLARYVRTSMLADGKMSSQQYTQLMTGLLLAMTSDVVSNHDSRNYVLTTPYCCQAEHFNDYDCAANLIPEDDPVFRYTDMRCLNMTRPWTFQSKGCIHKGSTPERISQATPMMDLSLVYGTSQDLDRFRTLEGGLFKYEMVYGKPWPLSLSAEESVCSGNALPQETRCHDVPDKFGANSLGPINMYFMWFWRNHNHLAENLGKVNPTWSDQKLFDTARDINIAQMSQMYYYELSGQFFGHKRLVEDGVLSETDGFRDVYDEEVLPKLSLEFPYALRWIHTMQEGSLHMYDAEGNYIDKFPVVNQTLRTGHFFNDNKLASLTHGAILQPCAKADFVVDPDISEMGFGGLQKISDITTSDLSKSRYYGLPPYHQYREFCSGKPVTSWEDLEDVMEPENIENLKLVYADFKDVELLAGIWVENYMPDSSSPYTYYCIMKDQLLRNVVSDRFWYERPNRPNAFTAAQLAEIRKSSIARLLCDNGDSVTRIQPHAFLRHGPGNEFTDCSNIPNIDFTKWAESAQA